MLQQIFLSVHTCTYMCIMICCINHLCSYFPLHLRTQVKSIQDAIRDKKQRFLFEGIEIRLTPTVGLFITMNPGYAGRTELPENLKALFRPCAMVVPDFELIAEIMLVAEGFIEARILARKFLTLYTLCKVWSESIYL